MINRIVIVLITFLMASNFITYFIAHHMMTERDAAYFQLTDLKYKVELQNNSIDQLVIAQDEKVMEIKKAQEDALKLRNKLDKEAKLLLSQKVSTNCDQAMQWGASQGHVIYECWVGKC